MGKDLEPCCEACKQFGDGHVTEERDAPALLPTTAWLVVTRGNQVIREVPLQRGITTIGRGRDATVQLDDIALSRRQCHFDVGDSITITDDHSTCGTYLDGRKISSAIVREGSWMLVGNCYMRIVSR